MSRTVAIVPLRAPGVGKTRLAPMLDPAQRAALAGAMLGDVVAALRTADLGEVVVAAGGQAAVSAASALGVEVLADPPGVHGLDEVVDAAVRRVAAPHDDVIVVTADLPRVTGDDLDAVLDTDAEVVVATARETGTAALLRRPGTRIATAYGPGSAGRHLRLAQDAGVRWRRVGRAGFADVDTWEDLAALQGAEVGPATAALLPALIASGRRRAAGAG